MERRGRDGGGGGGKRERERELESELARKGISRRGWMLISIFQLRRRRRRDLAPSPPRDRENRFERIIFRVDTEKSRYRPRNSRLDSRNC